MSHSYSKPTRAESGLVFSVAGFHCISLALLSFVAQTSGRWKAVGDACVHGSAARGRDAQQCHQLSVIRQGDTPGAGRSLLEW